MRKRGKLLPGPGPSPPAGKGYFCRAKGPPSPRSSAYGPKESPTSTSAACRSTFDSLEQAFDPDRNVAYAIGFLRDLRARWGSWTRAVGSYHSNTPTLSGRYRAKVFKMVYAEKHRIAKKRRAARLAKVANDLRPPSVTPVIR